TSKSAHPRTNECDQTKRRGKVEGREEGKGTGDREGNAGEGTNGLEVTGSSKRDAVCPGVSTTVAHSSSFLKPTKGPTCNAERKERKRNKEGKKAGGSEIPLGQSWWLDRLAAEGDAGGRIIGSAQRPQRCMRGSSPRIISRKWLISSFTVLQVWPSLNHAIP
ncbi:uncharacterized protein BO87DRAFT_447489, partial [Aspergillus neoniger CBS 115656]